MYSKICCDLMAYHNGIISFVEYHLMLIRVMNKQCWSSYSINFKQMSFVINILIRHEKHKVKLCLVHFVLMYHLPF